MKAAGIGFSLSRGRARANLLSCLSIGGGALSIDRGSVDGVTAPNVYSWAYRIQPRLPVPLYIDIRK